MKTNRELVLDLLRQCTEEAEAEGASGVTTQYLSRRLCMQRSNISSILNTLVKEGVVEKKEGRPVLFQLRRDRGGCAGASCFGEFIGSKHSMKRAVQLAKAAVLYPKHSLHTLLIGANGTGKSYFAELMYRFAVENRVLLEDAPFVTFDCAYYAENPVKMTRALFGEREDGRLHYMQRAEDGILFIEHGELLPSEARTRLFRIIENNYDLVDGKMLNRNTTVICSVISDAPKRMLDMFQNCFTISIRLLPLEERKLEERLQMIQRFFTVEAQRSQKTLVITSEILIALLLYPCQEQVKQLKNDIKIACANAYVREYQTQNGKIKIAMSDFPYGIRTGLLCYKNHIQDMRDIISEDSNYVFSATAEMKREKHKSAKPQNNTIYGWIDTKTSELRARGIPEQDINTIVSIDIENEFSRYTTQLSSRVVDKHQLGQLVEYQLINMVQEFISEVSRNFNRVYPASVFYGLCLHLNEAVKGGERKQKLSNQKIMEIVERYKEEYSYSMKFAARLEQTYDIRLPIDEVIFITMFISEKELGEENASRPVVLVAMHGDGAAACVAEVVKALSGSPMYAYDMPLDKKTQDAYQDLKELALSIHKGRGILAIYDMGSLGEILEMVSAETGITIKCIEIPLTVLALDCQRKGFLENDVEEIYDSVVEKYKGVSALKEAEYHRPKAEVAIVTLCMSGEGGAVQIKRYLEKNMDMGEIQVIPLSISDRKLLLSEINRIHEKSHIHCTIGTYDPQIVGIPFIPIAQVLQCPPENLRLLLDLDGAGNYACEKGEDRAFDENCRQILEHLGEELNHADPEMLRSQLPKLLTSIERNVSQAFTPDQKVGLLVHVACCIDRILAGENQLLNIYKDEILSRNQDVYEKLKVCFLPIEAAFHIEIGEHEYAYIISIITKSKRG